MELTANLARKILSESLNMERKLMIPQAMMDHQEKVE